MEGDHILDDCLEIELLKKSLKNGKQVHFKALGSSMFPFIRSGDLVTVIYCNPDDLSIGDVVFFENNNSFFLHRLIKKESNEGKEYFFTKGDCMPSPDQPFLSKDILGKLVNIQRNNHFISLDSNFNKFIGPLLAFFSPINYTLFKTFIKIHSLSAKVFLKIILNFNRIKIVRKFKKGSVSGINYKKASINDYHLISQFYHITPEQLDPPEKNSFYIIAQRKNKIMASLYVGKAWEQFLNHDWWIMSLEVNPYFRGAGIGEELVLKTINQLKKQGINAVFINLFENNPAAFNLYKKLGFEEIKSFEIKREINDYYKNISPNSAETIILRLIIK